MDSDFLRERMKIKCLKCSIICWVTCEDDKTIRCCRPKVALVSDGMCANFLGSICENSMACLHTFRGFQSSDVWRTIFACFQNLTRTYRINMHSNSARTETRLMIQLYWQTCKKSHAESWEISPKIFLSFHETSPPHNPLDQFFGVFSIKLVVLGAAMQHYEHNASTKWISTGKLENRQLESDTLH